MPLLTHALAMKSVDTLTLLKPQIKDRHNGNILVDEEGHLVHIDFGFMLSNSPGGVNFESAPFKLTRELLQVMDSDSDGRASELFDYFKVLSSFECANALQISEQVPSNFGPPSSLSVSRCSGHENYAIQAYNK